MSAPDPKPCVHFVRGACTAQLCRWQDYHAPAVCKLGGRLTQDALSARNPKAYTAEYDPERRPL